MLHHWKEGSFDMVMNGSINGSLIDTNINASVHMDNYKPREERDLAELYPDLDESKHLKMFVIDNEDDDDDEMSDDNKFNNHNIKSELDLKKPHFNLINKGTEMFTNSKFSKVIEEYGFRDPNKGRTKKDLDTYFRPFALSNNEKGIEEVLSKNKKQVGYDMDEQDYLYLKYRNQQPNNVIKITPEVFEILISVLENEWEALELHMNSVNSNDSDPSKGLYTLDEESNDDKYGNDDGIVHGSYYEQRCAICNDSECENSNAIVFCDGCNIAVHQECYGIAFIPEGQWLCRKCMITKNRQVNCIFCPSHTGAFKQLDNSLWSHVICALWINELYFANPIYMEPIEGIDMIPKSRWKLTCYICRQKIGACIQCTNKNCFQAYHVTCAKRAGLYMQLSAGVQGAVNNKATLRSFCDRHGPTSLDRDQVLLGIDKTRIFFRDIRILNMQNAKLTKSQRNANKLNIFKWKTENDTPIAPKLFSDVLFKTMIDLKVEDQFSFSVNSRLTMLRDLGYAPQRTKQSVMDEIEQISNEICRFWALKRELKKGAPLIRKNDNLNSSSSILYGNNTCEEIDSKIEFATALVKDLDKIKNVTELIISRQIVANEIHLLDSKMIDTVYFPIKKLIHLALSDINNRYDKSHFVVNYNRKKLNGNDDILGLHDIEEKNKRYMYLSVRELESDVRRLAEAVITENKPSSSICKHFKRWMRGFESLLPSLLKNETGIKRDFNNGKLNIPFIDNSDEQISFTDYNPQEVLRENDLSEVEDFADPEQSNRELQNFLKGLV